MRAAEENLQQSSNQESQSSSDKHNKEADFLNRGETWAMVPSHSSPRCSCCFLQNSRGGCRRNREGGAVGDAEDVAGGALHPTSFCCYPLRAQADWAKAAAAAALLQACPWRCCPLQNKSRLLCQGHSLPGVPFQAPAPFLPLLGERHGRDSLWANQPHLMKHLLPKWSRVGTKAGPGCSQRHADLLAKCRDLAEGPERDIRKMKALMRLLKWISFLG